MNEKMTDEELKEAGTNATERRLKEHIAALTAERDEAQRRVTDLEHANQKHAAIVRAERDALRERVTALEVARDAAAQLADAERLDREHAESRLTAIRQRAENIQRPGVAASVAGTTTGAAQDVARYILGGGAPAPSETSAERVARICAMHDARIVGGMDAHPSESLNPDATGEADQPLLEGPVSEMDGLRGEMAEKPTLPPLREYESTGERTLATEEPPTPTTPEAFAAVREGIRCARNCEALPSCCCGADEATLALSLLELRVGAQDKALRALLDAQKHGGNIGAMWWLWRLVETALTDAPPVFTLEEIQAALVAELESQGNCGVSYVDCCAAACDGLVKRLTALRR